ncbi:hypothetical protein BDV59DRAFT_180923 [Aspergillus ambiguus]|uniref:putative formin binding protein n=1 Tax=Aspergillus ambiguus TaxID=176160 RepID=UPI003CCCB190
MAEYWKSAPRHWCKQCKVFIRDTAFEKAQHEATAKHQGNLKRFLRDIHRDNERQQRETQKAKSEVERLRQTVSGGGSGALRSGDAAGSWKRAPAVSQPTERPVSLEERKKQMAQLADMGIAIPEEFRRDMALTGEWQTVSERVIRPADEESSGQPESSLGVRKRKHEPDVDEEEEEARREAERFVSKGWGSRTKAYPGAGDDADLDALLSSTTELKKPKAPAATADASAEEDKNETTSGESDKLQAAQEKPSDASGSAPVAKAELEDAGVGVVFKKRKPKAMRK